MDGREPNLPIETPKAAAPEAFFDAGEAVDRLIELYQIRNRVFERTILGNRDRGQAALPVPRLLPRDPDHHDQFRRRRQPAELRPCRLTRHLLHDRHAARSFRQLPAPADRAC